MSIYSFVKNGIYKKITIYEELPIINGLLEDALIITGKSTWSNFKKRYEKDKTIPLHEEKDIYFPNSPYLSELENTSSLQKMIDSHSKIIAIGGGRVCDCAKYLGKTHKKRTVIIPTILSTTAWVNPIASLKDNPITNKIIHKNGRIDEIFIDFDLISQSPSHLNYGGLADILCGYAGLMDWKIAGGFGFMKKAMKKFIPLLNSLLSTYNNESQLHSESIRKLMDAFIETRALCFSVLSGRPLEGGEHLLYYALEEQMDTPMNHGKIIAINTLVCLHLQKMLKTEEYIISKVDTLISSLNQFYHKKNLLNNFEENFLKKFESIVNTMPEYVVNTKRPQTIWNFYTNEQITQISHKIITQILNQDINE